MGDYRQPNSLFSRFIILSHLPLFRSHSSGQDEYGGYSSQVGTLDDIKFADEDGDEEDDGQDRRNGNLR